MKVLLLCLIVCVSVFIEYNNSALAAISNLRPEPARRAYRPASRPALESIRRRNRERERMRTRIRLRDRDQSRHDSNLLVVDVHEHLRRPEFGPETRSSQMAAARRVLPKYVNTSLLARAGMARI